jgi:hypothetical protein
MQVIWPSDQPGANATTPGCTFTLEAGETSIGRPT